MISSGQSKRQPQIGAFNASRSILTDASLEDRVGRERASELLAECNRLLPAVGVVAEDRKFCLTEKGRIGQIPSVAQKDDVRYAYS